MILETVTLTTAQVRESTSSCMCLHTHKHTHTQQIYNTCICYTNSHNISYALFSVDGGWTEWSEFSECSTTCDNGTQTRSRNCTNPVPQYGGRDCEGSHREIQMCFLKHCPIDCVWLPWTSWTNCSHECGGGLMTRSRDSLVEQHGGKPCEGSPFEMQGCNEHPCPSMFL